ncbi:MAG TPA: helix-turn-helix domain-containing protein, partial [Microbacterium sp.]|nr:helix-turn-helix domain-containing protein [Microbacterium sp.]
MPRASAAEAAATAARVLDAAEKRFTAQGFGAASVDDIAADAGVTRGAVYHHYDSKPGLFLAVVQRMQQQVADAVVAAAGDATPADSLRLGS